jgi:hypothetical protein
MLTRAPLIWRSYGSLPCEIVPSGYGVEGYATGFA